MCESAAAQTLSAPTLNTISPNFGNPNTFVTVTLTGTNLAAPPGSPAYPVSVSGNGITVIEVTATPTVVTATLAIGSAAGLGYRQIAIGTSNSRTFTVLPASTPPPAPVLSAISPTFGSPGQSVKVTLTGTNFVLEPTVTVTGGVVAVGPPTKVTPTSWTGTFAVSAGATPGNRMVTVTTPSGTSNPVSFAIATTTPIVITGTVTDAETGQHIPGVIIADQCRQPDAVTETDATGQYKFIAAVVSCNDSGAVALTYSKAGYRLAVRPSFENRPDSTNFFTASAVANVALTPYRTAADYTAIARRTAVARTHTDSGSLANPLDEVTFPAGTFQQDDILFVDVISPDGGGDVNFGVTLTTGLGSVELLTANKAGHRGHAQVYGEFSNPTGTSLVLGPSHSSFSHSLPPWPGESASTDNQFNADTGQTNWITGPFTLTLHHLTAGGPRWLEWQIVRLNRHTASSPATPVLNMVSPNFGSAGTFVDVTLTGANFVPGLSIILVTGDGVTVRGLDAAPTTLKATLAISSTAALGYRQIIVMTPVGLDRSPLFSDTRTFTILAPSAPTPPPTLDGISRSVANPGERIYVTLTGTNFVPGSTVHISEPGGISVILANVLNANTITANFWIDSTAALGARQVSVKTPAGVSSGAVPFFVAAPVPPVFASFGPGSVISPLVMVRNGAGGELAFGVGPHAVFSNPVRVTLTYPGALSTQTAISPTVLVRNLGDVAQAGGLGPNSASSSIVRVTSVYAGALSAQSATTAIVRVFNSSGSTTVVDSPIVSVRLTVVTATSDVLMKELHPMEERPTIHSVRESRAAGSMSVGAASQDGRRGRPIENSFDFREIQFLAALPNVRRRRLQFEEEGV